MTDARRQSTQQLTQPATGSSGYALVLYHRDGATATPLRIHQSIVVGRVAPADVVVQDESLSRQHARFVLRDDGVEVEDLGSTNGTWIGGESITVATLRPGEAAMLGAVTAAVQVVGGEGPLGLAGHDRFLSQLDGELVRAGHFRRPFAMLMLREAGGSFHQGVQDILAALQPVDMAALYSANTLELLLPEVSTPDALTLAARIAQARPRLLFGIAAYPDHGTSAAVLLQACREAVERATPDRAVQTASVVGVAEHAPSTDVDTEGIVATSSAMQEVLELARRVARGIIPVYLHGETGTGKEVLTHFIHARGPRKDGPLVAVNCAAIPASLLESTLFGHVKGAFTGAQQPHAGVFEAASGGTLLLDEVGELPAAAQAALLRVLETKTITRIGSTKEIPVDVRVIAASHKNLEAMAERSAFREDLYYRLNGLTLEIPPLRRRREDIVPLALRFLDACRATTETRVRDIAPDAREALASYSWPGNIRELRNAIERAAVIAEHEVIGLRDLPRSISDLCGIPTEASPAYDVGPHRLRRPAESFRACMERLEAEVLEEALLECDANQSEAARQLDMPRRTLVHKIKTLKIGK